MKEMPCSQLTTLTKEHCSTSAIHLKDIRVNYDAVTNQRLGFSIT